MAVCVNYMLD